MKEGATRPVTKEETLLMYTVHKTLASIIEHRVSSEERERFLEVIMGIPDECLKMFRNVAELVHVKHQMEKGGSMEWHIDAAFQCNRMFQDIHEIYLLFENRREFHEVLASVGMTTPVKSASIVTPALSFHVRKVSASRRTSQVVQAPTASVAEERMSVTVRRLMQTQPANQTANYRHCSQTSRASASDRSDR